MGRLHPFNNGTSLWICPAPCFYTLCLLSCPLVNTVGGTDGPSISNGSTEEAAGKEVSTAVAPPIGRSRPWGWLIALAALLLLAVAAVILGSWARPNLPHLGKSVQITSDGWQKDRLAVSGTVLFFDTLGGRPEAITRIDQNGAKGSRINKLDN